MGLSFFLDLNGAENPNAASVVLNRLLEVYKKHHDKAFTKTESIAFFRDQAADYRKRLLDAEKSLKEFKMTWNIVDIQRQNEVNLELIADLEQEINNHAQRT
jgi:capsule polysaccharide export protein KpsE/RkpR